MGQVLNRVKCPSCNYTSRIFEPFNMLSLPFPNVTEVLFRCIVIRRATALNCSKTLSFSDNIRNRSLKPPSKQLIAEEYIVPMSRVADITELKPHLTKICDIEQERLKLYTVIMNTEDDMVTLSENISLTLIQDNKYGPCSGYSNIEKSDELTNRTTTIIAFELTLNPRVEQNEEGLSLDTSVAEIKDTDETKKSKMHALSRLYGNEEECRLYDTNPTLLARYLSESMWPRSAADIVIGLRVDAIDQRSHWFPGTVVEVTRSNSVGSKASKVAKSEKMKIKVHFDNFSTKWDLTYTLDEISSGKVKPLYSFSHPRDSPIEIQAFHALSHKPLALFGLPFFTHCYSEWSNARAGAQILAQASRFLEGEPHNIRQVDENNILAYGAADTKNADAQRRCKEAQDAIAKAIDILLDADKRYVNHILFGLSDGMDKCTTLVSKLEKQMSLLSPFLPFDLLVYDATSSPTPTKNNNEPEPGLSPFTFSLDRTFGNCINARQEIIICWKEIKKLPTGERLYYYSPPRIFSHKESFQHLRKRHDQIKERSGGDIQNAMNIDSCLDEFCNEQQLNESECWRCPKCKDLREGIQRMNLWRLPDLLIFHLKRFNCSARWREKITNKINFPLTGLNMKEWCDKQSPIMEGCGDDCVYDLIGVVNHYGGMTSGHYIAVSKATACSPEGSEEVEHYFNGAGVHAFGGTDEKEVQPTLWKLIRSKEKDANNAQSRAAKALSESAAESSEPLWLQFDDESVEPIPPSEVVTETAYVLFYRRRRIDPSNIAKYSTIE